MLRASALLTLLALASTGWAQDNRTLSPEQDEVMRVEDVWRVAKLKQDLTALSAVMTDDFYEMNQNGNGRNKQETLDLWKWFSIRDLVTDSYEVTVTGNVAVVRGTQTENKVERMLFTRVYTKTDRGWQLLSSMQARNPKVNNLSFAR